MRYAIPLVVFIVIVGFLASRLRGGYDPHIIPSALIDKPAPGFQLPELRDPARTRGAQSGDATQPVADKPVSVRPCL